MMYIKNLDEIIDNLADLLYQFDVNLNEYQTDVYLYLDEDGNGRLEEFVNVGGNSWLNDDHRTIYTDKEHNNTVFDSFDNLGDLFDAIEISRDEITKRVMESTGLDEDELEYWDFVSYIREDDELYSRLVEAYKGYLKDQVDYRDYAIDVLTDLFDKDYDEEEGLY